MSPADLSEQAAESAPDYEAVSVEMVWAPPAAARFRWPVSEEAGVAAFSPCRAMGVDSTSRCAARVYDATSESQAEAR